MTPQNRGPGWGSMHSQPSSEAGGMLRKSRIGKGEDEPQRCVSCWMRKKDARQRDCLCVRCDACVRNNTERHNANCTRGGVND